MLLTTREVSNHILSFKFNSTYQFVDLLVRKSSDVVHSPISQEQLIRPDTLLIRRVTSADVHPPLLAKEVVTPTLVVAVVTVTHKFLPVASEFVDERDAVIAGIGIRDKIPVTRNARKLDRSPPLGSLSVTAKVGVRVCTNNTGSVPAVGLAEEFDVDCRGRGGEGEEDSVTHFEARLMT
jgi:hypothetical protein